MDNAVHTLRVEKARKLDAGQVKAMFYQLDSKASLIVTGIYITLSIATNSKTANFRVKTGNYVTRDLHAFNLLRGTRFRGRVSFHSLRRALSQSFLLRYAN